MALDNNFSSKRRRIEDLISLNQSELLVAEETAVRCRARQYELKSQLNSTTAVTSLLPREVLAEIFLAVLPRGLYVLNQLPREYIIARVCKEWRELAWNTPRLWCRIAIKLDSQRYKAQKCLIEEWIQRSGECPLEMKIIVDSDYDPQWEPPADAFDNIIQSCTRWKTFICNAFTSLSMALDKGMALRFPWLENLEIRKNEALDYSLEGWNFDFPPRLRRLHITDSLSDCGLAVNWSALTSLRANILLGPRLEAPTECISLKVLMSCRSLVSLTCELKTSIVDPNHVFYPTTVCFPSLQSLSLTAMTCTTAQFMAMTVLPALTTLNIYANNSLGPNSPEDPAWINGLIDWAKRSSFKLEVLKISSNNLVEDRHLADMICQLSPSQPLRILGIYMSNNLRFQLSNSLIKQLSMRRRGGIKKQRQHLPHLGFFEFGGKISFTVSAMISMLESRKRYAELLKEPGMEESSDADADDDEEAEDEGNDGDSGEDGDGKGDEHESKAEDEVANEYPLSDSPSFSPETLTIEIDYINRSWLQMQNPNRMRKFYRTVEWFDTDGRSFYCDWNGCTSSDSDSDLDSDSDED